jgi:hypothetical protein
MGKSQSLELETRDLPRRSGPPPQYLDLEKLKNADGIVAIISQRLANRVITFAFFKEFERDNRFERTSFIADSLRPSYLAMVKMACERMDEIAKNESVMQKLQLEAISKLDEIDADHCRRLLKLRGGRS